MTVWPVPLPDWYWAWAEWYLGRGAYKQHKRDPDWRPGNVPAKIPYWAWARLAAQLGNPIPKPPAAPPPPPPKPKPPANPSLDKARAMLDYCRGFTGHYLYGGGHGKLAKDVSRHDDLDCSSSVSKVLDAYGLLGSPYVQVSTWFETWRYPGMGRLVTVHANHEHVWIEFDLPEGYFRFDTSPHGDGRTGPRVRTRRRFDSSFYHRHASGL
jgi:hypothetical protein